MNSDKLVFSAVIIAILCFTVMVSQCTYNAGQCKQEAIKAGKLDAVQVRQLCGA